MPDNDRIAFVQSPAPAAPAAVAPGGDAASGAGASKLWAGAEPSFHDVLDALNPLHQIPIVSSLYENATGDTIGFLPRLVGGALFGGPLGFGAALASGLFEQATGKTPGESLIAAFSGGSDAPTEGSGKPPTLVANRSGGRDGDSGLQITTPAAPSSAASTPAADAAGLAANGNGKPPVLVASYSGGRDGNVGLETASPASLSRAPSALAADAAKLASNGSPQPTPQQRAEQLALEAAHEARFGRSTVPLLQQASLIAAGTGASRSPLLNQAGPGSVPSQALKPAAGVDPLASGALAAGSAIKPSSQPAPADDSSAPPPQVIPTDGVPKAMMQALDKYQLLLKQRQAAGANSGQQVDTSL